MIASLQGEVIGFGEDSLVVNVGGIGLRVFVTATQRAQTVLGNSVFLYTHLIVREDALSLYGFVSEDERDFYNLLLGVNGIGPRIALVLLSTLPVDNMRRAVLSEQPELFARVPGVGKKTAQKIILYLQGKIKGEFPTTLAGISTDSEVLEALVGLGYSVVEAQTALQSISKDAPQDIEERLKLALKYFSS